MADEIAKSIIDTLIAEAGGQGEESMRRVAETILNRSAIRGLSPEQVIQEPYQYTGYSNPGPAARQAQQMGSMRSAAEAAWQLAQQPGDPTGGADHYYAPGTISQPSWARNMKSTGEYGGHNYYSSRPIPPGSIPNAVASALSVEPRIAPNPASQSPDLAQMRNPIMSSSARNAQVTPYPVPPMGMISPGNINPNNRPIVQNSDGSISTVRTISANIDGPEVLMPTVSPDGRIWTDDQAIDNYIRTGQNFGQFKTPDAATAFAERLHNSQADQYLPRANTPYPATQSLDLAIRRAPGETIDTIPTSGIGAAPTTRSVQSIPMTGNNQSAMMEATRRAALMANPSYVERSPPVQNRPALVQDAARRAALMANQSYVGQDRNPPLSQARLAPGPAAQNYNVALNGPAGLTRQQFSALNSLGSILPRQSAPMPLMASSALQARRTSPLIRGVNQAMAPVLPQVRQAPQYGLPIASAPPLRIVVDGANVRGGQSAPMQISGFTNDGNGRLTSNETGGVYYERHLR